MDPKVRVEYGGLAARQLTSRADYLQNLELVRSSILDSSQAAFKWFLELEILRIKAEMLEIKAELENAYEHDPQYWQPLFDEVGI